jgi:hypothetical protein
MKGGKQGEMKERRRLQQIEDEKHRASMLKNEAIRAEHKKKTDQKREELG